MADQETEKMKLTDLESDAVRDAFDDEAGKTNTKSSTTKGEGDGNKTGTEENKNDVELQPLNNDGQTDNFAVYTSDVSFMTKVRLLLWKNFRIQIIRRPLACCCKIAIPLFVMLIMVAFTAIPGMFHIIYIFVCFHIITKHFIYRYKTGCRSRIWCRI